MKKKVAGTLHITLFCLLLSLCLGSIARADNATIKKEITKNYQLYKELLESINTEDIIAMQTEDFIHVSVDDKVMQREESDTLFRLISDRVQRVNGAGLRINQMKIERHRVVCVVTEYYDAMIRDDFGKLHRFTSNAVNQDIWVPTENGYKLKQSKSLRGIATMGDKTIRRARK